MWIPQLACTRCRQPLESDGAAWCCRSCGSGYHWRSRILRAAAPEPLAQMAPFFEQYRLVRERDGYRLHDAGYYRRLPEVAADDPRASEWRLRRESFERLRAAAIDGSRGRALRVLDLGAGNGWLSHQLTATGHRAVAIDLLDDDADGLGAARHYPTPFALVQAQFDALPFVSGVCDLAVFNASLHYAAAPGQALREAFRALAPGGALVVMDSPMFRRAEAGEAMVHALGTAFAARYGVEHPQRPGVGYLTFDLLAGVAVDLGLRAKFYRTWGPIAWQFRRHMARVRLRRPPAAFGVWVAR